MPNKQRLRVPSIAVSLDGFMAGADQTEAQPMGIGGGGLHKWVFETRFGREMMGKTGGNEGVDNDFLLKGDEGIGAHIIGRNMFGPIRGGWGDEEWKGWWGPNPPYGHDVFVLTHHRRASLEMEGGTTFHFVTDGIESALDQAFAAADGQDVRVGGGASTIQQYLNAGLVDELHLGISPNLLLGAGERLFDNLDNGLGDLVCVERVATDSVVHLRFSR